MTPTLDRRDGVTQLVRVDLERHARGQRVRVADDLHCAHGDAVGKSEGATRLTAEDRSEREDVVALTEDNLTIFGDDERDEALTIGQRPDPRDTRRDAAGQHDAGHDEREDEGAGKRHAVHDVHWCKPSAAPYACAPVHHRLSEICTQEGT